MTQTDCHKRHASKKGFVLVLVAGLMIVLGIVLLKSFPVSSDIKFNNVKKTKTLIKDLKRAILIYYERNGDLPCPSDNSLAMNDPSFGVESCATGPVLEGGVPFKELGLPSSYTFDDWNKRITYVMDTSYTGYESGGDNINITDIAGNNITGQNGGVIPQFMGLVISHGENGIGAYGLGRTAAPTFETTCGAAANTEDDNCDGDTNFVRDLWNPNNDDLVEILTPCPGAVNGCSLWLDADDDGGSNDTIETSTNFVWMDKSGNGNDAIQATVSRKPTIVASGINERRALEFDGGDFANTTSQPINTDDYSLFVVADQTNSSDNDLLGSGSQFSAGNFILRNSGDRARADYWQTASTLRWANGATTPREVPTIYSSTLDATSLNVERDGFLEGTNSVATARANLTKPIYIGSVNTNTGDAFEGKMGEVVVYDRPLTEEQRTRVQCGMAKKWGTFPREDLQLWLDAQDIDGDGDSSAGDQPANGDAVTTWVNKSGVAGFDVQSQSDPDMPARSISDPTYNATGIGGSFPSIEFDGSGNDFMTGAKDDRISGADSSESTIILVAEPEDATDIIVSYSGNSRGPWAVSNRYLVNSSGGWSDLNMASVATTGQIRVMKYDQVTQSAYVNSSSQGSLSNSTAISGSDPEDRFRVGRTGWDSASSTNQLDGNIGEILVYNRALSDEEIRIAECYLSEKWDVGINYPAP